MITGEKKFLIVIGGIKNSKNIRDICAENHISEADYQEWERHFLEKGAALFEDQREQIELHNAALAATRYEGTLLWQIFGAFLLIHTVAVGFILQGIPMQPSPTKDLRILLEGLLGLGLCCIWAATYLRNSAHYRFFLARARETEPGHWNIYGGKGRAFSLGEMAFLGESQHQLSWPANWVKSGRMVPPVIFCFFLIYALAIFFAVSSQLGQHDSKSETVPVSKTHTN